MPFYNTFSPRYLPSVGSGPSSKARVIKNQFGDGYRQTGKDGLNAVVQTQQLSWNMLDNTSATNIEQFFIVNVGKPFWWTPVRSAVPLLWDCEEWSRIAVTGAHDKITATFVQRFDL